MRCIYSLNISEPIGLPTLAQIEGEQARRAAERDRGSAVKAATESLSSFVRQGWHVVEPDEHLVWNWHIDLVCDHLQAISRGELRDLLVNIPPGSAKSLLCCVFWPAWMWTHRPNWQSIFASYDRELTIRDSLRCRDLVTSDWYRETFRPEWKLKSDLNVKSWFANTAGGWRVSTSVGGKGTGMRADCLRGDTLVATEVGQKRIDVLAADPFPPRVWSLNHYSGALELNRIVWSRVIRGRMLKRIVTGLGGEVYCTHAHKIFAAGEYREADCCKQGQSLIALRLPPLWQSQGETGKGLLGLLPEGDRQLPGADLRSMRKEVQKDTVSSVEQYGSGTHAVYDLQVEENHNFFANGILVHNCVAVDDAHNIKLRPTDDEFAHVRHWWFVRMSNRLRDQRRGARVCIGQRVDERDLSSHILTHGGYTHLCLPTEFGQDRRCETKWGKDPRTTLGELMFPQRFGEKENAEAKNELGPEAYAAQHDQRPAPMVGNIFKQSWFRFWYPRDGEIPRKFMSRLEDGTIFLHEQVELPEGLSEIQSWDMTFKERSIGKGKRKTDFVVGQTWGVRKKERYLLMQLRGRWSFTEAVDAVRQMSLLYPRADLKLVEDAANGPAIMNQLKAEIGGFEPVTPMGGKEARAHSASHTVRAGFVYIPHPDVYPWVKELMHEVCTFPNAPNDDQVDAMTQLINSTKEQASYGYQSAAKRLSFGGDVTQQRGVMRADGSDVITSRRRGIL